MDNDEKNIDDKVQEELERQFFGEEIYKFNYKLPVISLSEDNECTFYKPKFITHIELIKDMTDVCGKEIAMLFAECYKIYQIEEKPENAKGNIISNFCKVALGQIALAQKQSEKLLIKLKNSDKDEIIGEEYCFISLMLNNILCYYTTIFNSIFSIEYISDEELDIMKERLLFILSPEIQILRRLFKCVECVEALDPDSTIH